MLFSQKITSSKSHTFQSNKLKIVHISAISLDTNTDNKESVDVFMENAKTNETYKICSLKKNSCETYSANISFALNTPKEKFIFKINKNNFIVNLIGSIEEEEEENENQEIKLNESEEEESNKSDNDSDESEDVIEKNQKEVSITELLNKKRKEEPQNIKPILLKNLSTDNKEKNKNKKNKDKKHNKNNMENKGNKNSNDFKKSDNKNKFHNEGKNKNFNKNKYNNNKHK